MAMIDKPQARGTDASAPTPKATTPSHSNANPGLAARFLPVTVAACFLISALILPQMMFHRGQPADVPGLGPGAWPNGVLAALAFFSAIWLALEIWNIAKSLPSTSLIAPQEDDTYHFGKAIGGIALVLAFGWLLPVLGFALATSLFLFVWCLYGGLRHPLALLLVPTVGTVALLWMFMGLALMPLSRGVGPFEQFSVAFLQLIRIY